MTQYSLLWQELPESNVPGAHPQAAPLEIGTKYDEHWVHTEELEHRAQLVIAEEQAIENVYKVTGYSYSDSYFRSQMFQGHIHKQPH